jgi:hypothetical protein
MALTRAERFKLKSRMLAEIDDSDSGWDLRRQNLLLTEFALPSLSGDWNDGPFLEDLIADLPDAALIEMYAIVLDQEPEEVASQVEESDSGNWKQGYVRLFISHSAKHKAFIGKIADELAVTGIHGFVAHDTMEYSKPWQNQIEQALRSMQAFVAITHPEFNDSAWCQQEVGWALGRRVPSYAVRLGADPAGFIGSNQWPSGHGMNAKPIANLISAWVATIPELGDRMVDGLFSALATANNYMDAGATASRITALGGLTESQWARLDEIYRANDQVHGGALPSKALKPFYQEHHRAWPPSEPASPVPPADPWTTNPTQPDPWATPSQ